MSPKMSLEQTPCVTFEHLLRKGTDSLQKGGCGVHVDEIPLSHLVAHHLLFNTCHCFIHSVDTQPGGDNTSA
jgi:hypothetical protein